MTVTLPVTGNLLRADISGAGETTASSDGQSVASKLKEKSRTVVLDLQKCLNTTWSTTSPPSTTTWRCGQLDAGHRDRAPHKRSSLRALHHNNTRDKSLARLGADDGCRPAQHWHLRCGPCGSLGKCTHVVKAEPTSVHVRHIARVVNPVKPRLVSRPL